MSRGSASEGVGGASASDRLGCVAASRYPRPCTFRKDIGNSARWSPRRGYNLKLRTALENTMVHSLQMKHGRLGGV